MYGDAANVLFTSKYNDFHSSPRVCSDAVDKRAGARFLRQLVDAWVSWHLLTTFESYKLCFNLVTTVPTLPILFDMNFCEQCTSLINITFNHTRHLLQLNQRTFYITYFAPHCLTFAPELDCALGETTHTTAFCIIQLFRCLRDSGVI